MSYSSLEPNSIDKNGSSFFVRPSLLPTLDPIASKVVFVPPALSINIPRRINSASTAYTACRMLFFHSATTSGLSLNDLLASTRPNVSCCTISIKAGWNTSPKTTLRLSTYLCIELICLPAVPIAASYVPAMSLPLSITILTRACTFSFSVSSPVVLPS